jgi:hypothetical protein
VDEAKARKIAVDRLIGRMAEINGINDWLIRLKDILLNMSVKTFREFLKDIKDNKQFIPYILNAFDDKKKPYPYDLIDLGKKYGIQFMQKIMYTNPTTGDLEISDVERMVGMMPWRRQQQHLSHKIAIPKKNRVYDALSGQVAGDSRKASFSRTEQYMTLDANLNESLIELLGPRGGNTALNRAWYKQIVNTGNTDFTELKDRNERAKSSQTLSAMFMAMGLDNNL